MGCCRVPGGNDANQPSVPYSNGSPAPLYRLCRNSKYFQSISLSPAHRLLPSYDESSAAFYTDTNEEKNARTEQLRSGGKQEQMDLNQLDPG